MSDDLEKPCHQELPSVEGPIIHRLKQQADRIKKLEVALRVYAEEDHWFGDTFEPIMFPEGECKCCYEHFSDQGEIARKALEGKDE